MVLSRSCRPSEEGYGQYNTAWREPKVFVIDTLDEEGRLDRRTLPIYDCRFDQRHLFSLPGSYLSRLAIKEAISVQLLGDGAP